MASAMVMRGGGSNSGCAGADKTRLPCSASMASATARASSQVILPVVLRMRFPAEGAADMDFAAAAPLYPLRFSSVS